MWKWCNLLATQILREMTIWEFIRSKVSFLALLEVLNFDFCKFEPFLKYQTYQTSRLRVSEIVKMATFEIQILPKLISSKIEC